MSDGNPRGSFSGLRAPLRDRSSSVSARGATQSELFFDMTLIFSLQNMFLLPLTSTGIGQLALFYALLWNGWVGIAFFNTRFDMDDLVSRAFAVADMVAVVGMSLAIPTANVTAFVSFYMSIRVLLVVKYIRVWLSSSGSYIVSGFIIGFSLGVACWAVAICVPTDKAALLGVLIGCALLCDYGTPFALLRHMLPVHSFHFPERLAGMVVLMFCGTLFNFVQSLPSPLASLAEGGSGEAVQTSCDWLDFLSCATFGIIISFGHILLFMRVPGPDVLAFGRSFWTRLRVYLYIYLNMPLGLTAMVMSTSAGAIAKAIPGEPNTVHLDMFAVSCGLVHMLFVPLHLLAVTCNVRRAVRASCRLAQ